MRVVRINLLPATARPAKPLGLPQYALAAGAFAAVFGSAVYYRGLVRQREAALAAAAAAELRLAQVQARLEEAAALDQREQKVAALEQELKGMQGRAWSPVLLEMADLTPGGMSWELVSAGPEGVEVRGHVIGLSHLAQFVTGLSASDRVDRVEVHEYVEPESGWESGEQFHFYLTLRLKGDGQDADQPQ